MMVSSVRISHSQFILQRLIYLLFANEKWMHSRNENYKELRFHSTSGSDGAILAGMLFKRVKQMATLPDQSEGIVNVFP